MDYDKLTKKELIAKVRTLKKEITDYKFDIKSGDLSNLNEYRKAKKDLAVVSTIVTELNLGIRKEKKSEKAAVKVEKKSEKKVEKTEKKTKKKEETKVTKKSKK